jgi:hypothetical protein
VKCYYANIIYAKLVRLAPSKKALQ